MNELSFGILASGRLGAKCLEFLIKSRQIRFVFTDKASDEINCLCKIYDIPLFVGSPRNGKSTFFIKDFKIDVLLSINYLFIVEKDIISLPKKYAINFHGSLLPKYRGRTPHVWAIINNEKETGITAHLMSEECDEGDILYQKKIEIHEDSTGASILEEFNHLYPSIISNVIDMIEHNTVVLVKQNKSKATYFEKRTPEDGEINWNWQKERIHNWVRAQSKPYPGAFTFYNDRKIIINSIRFSDYGFNQNDTNGKILECKDEIIIKTPNGAIILEDFEILGNVKFIKGGAFYAKH